MPAPGPGPTSASLTVLELGPDAPPARDLAGVIDSASGTTVRRLGGLGDFSAVSLRGSSFRQVEVFLDGVPLNPDGSAAIDLSELPISAFQRVEIYRGNAPASFGSSAMGGVVNLVTPQGSVAPAVGLAGGSWGTGRVFGVAGPARGPVEAFLAVDQLHTEGDWRAFDDRGTEYNRLDDRTVIRANNAVDRTSLVARARFGPPGLRVTVLDSFARSHQELAGPIHAPAAGAAFAATRDLLVVSAETHPGPRWRLEPRAWGLWRQEDLDDRGSEIGVGPQWSRDTFVTAGTQAELAWVPSDVVSGSALARARRDSYAPYDRLEELADGTRVRHAATLSVTSELSARWLTFSPAMNLEILDNRLLGDIPFEDAPVAPAGEDFAVWALPRAGVLARPADALSIRANAGFSMRPPDFTELFGDRGSIIGNTDLVPEAGLAWDVGARLEGESPALRGSFDLAFAGSRFQDLIVYVQNSQYTQTPMNVGDASVHTLEAALDVDALGALRSGTNMTWMRTRNLVDDPAYFGNELPRLPSLELSQRTALRLRDRAEIAHTWTYTAPTWLDTTSTYLSAPRKLHGASLSVTPVAGLPTIQAEVLNLGDVRGMAVPRNPLSDDTPVVKPLTDFSGYPLPGRTVMISVSWVETKRTP